MNGSDTISFLRRPVSTCVILVAMMFVRLNEERDLQESLFVSLLVVVGAKNGQGFAGTGGSAINEIGRVFSGFYRDRRVMPHVSLCTPRYPTFFSRRLERDIPEAAVA